MARDTVPLMAGMSLLRELTVVVLETEQRLYRVCGPWDGERFEDDLRSHYELGRPPRGPENRAAVVHMAISMFERPAVAVDLALRVAKLAATSRRSTCSPAWGSASRRPAVPLTGRCGVARPGWPRAWQRLCAPTPSIYPDGETDLMTYSIFDGTGNLIDAFTDRAAALDCLAGIAQAEPASAGEVFLVAQEADGTTVGETIFASSVSVPA